MKAIDERVRAQARMVRAVRTSENGSDERFRGEVALLEDLILDECPPSLAEAVAALSRDRTFELVTGSGAPPTEAEKRSMQKLARAVNAYEPRRARSGSSQTMTVDVVQVVEPAPPDEVQRFQARVCLMCFAGAVAVVVAAVVAWACGYPLGGGR